MTSLTKNGALNRQWIAKIITSVAFARFTSLSTSMHFHFSFASDTRERRRKEKLIFRENFLGRWPRNNEGICVNVQTIFRWSHEWIYNNKQKSKRGKWRSVSRSIYIFGEWRWRNILWNQKTKLRNIVKAKNLNLILNVFDFFSFFLD